MQRRLAYSLLIAGVLLSQLAVASVTAIDDTQRQVSLSKPAQRIISLAPHTTELLFEAGAGHLLVGVSEYSDYPEQAKKIPSVGNIFALDLERVLALKPDLVLVWGTGNAKLLANKLRANHVKVFESEPHDFETVASSLERLGVLAGTETTAKAAAVRFRKRLASLRSSYAIKDTKEVQSVFYQVWSKPLMTINDKHFVSSAISLCGGKNIFGNLKEISPTVNIEAVLAANPQVIITTSGEAQDTLTQWLPLSSMTAVRKGNLFTLPGDWMNRAGPRILDGTEALCKHLAGARTKL